MDKKYAINFVKKEGAAALIIALYSNGDESSAEDILENCWGYSNKEIAEYIKDNWNF